MQLNITLSDGDLQDLRSLITSIFSPLFDRLLTMSQVLDDLVAQVQANTDVVSSAITFIQGIQAQLVAVQAELAGMGVTSAKLTELHDALAMSDSALADVLNPPVAPPATP